MSLPGKETDVTYKLDQPLDLFLVHKIVDHVNYDRLKLFAQLGLWIKGSDYESIIARESSPNKQVQGVSKTCRLELLIHVIGGSMGGARDAPPRGSKFFHFHALFSKNLKNNSNFGSWRTPLGKILDPPLHVKYVLSCAYLMGIGVSHTIDVGFLIERPVSHCRKFSTV